MTNKYHYYRTFNTKEDKRTSEGIIQEETPLKALEALVKEKGIFYAAILDGEIKKDYLERISNQKTQFLSDRFIKDNIFPSHESLFNEEVRGLNGIVTYSLWENSYLLEGYKIEKIKHEPCSPWENGIYMTKVE